MRDLDTDLFYLVYKHKIGSSIRALIKVQFTMHTAHVQNLYRLMYNEQHEMPVTVKA